MKLLASVAVSSLLTLGGLAHAAQSRAEGAAAFDTVSIKVVTGTPAALPPPAPDRYQKSRIRLNELITEAYGHRRHRIVNLPEWNATTAFQVLAKADGPLTPARTEQLLKAMLAERFALRTHSETRELPYYAMTVASEGKLGPRLKRTAGNCDEVRAERARRGEVGPRIPQQAGAEQPVCFTWFYAMSFTDGQRALRWLSGGTTMPQLANLLSDQAGRVVLDRTGLAGEFDGDLEFAILASVPAGAIAPERPSLQAAVEEQLGLKLESARGPIDVLVIDSVGLPTEN
jgi:uncharacterized protein (TIGR03435 family)